MAVWTISAQAGTGAAEIAAELAARADVPLLDRETLASFAHGVDERIENLSDLETRVGGRLNAFALALAMTNGSAEAFRELSFRRALPELGRTLLGEAARRPAVMLAHAAFAALSDHPAAVHVRLRAPFEWRVLRIQKDEVVARDRAQEIVRHEDHVQHNWVHTLYRTDVDDPAGFALVVDVSRFGLDRIAALLLSAAGVSGRPPGAGDERSA